MIIRSLDENLDWNFGHGLGSYLSGDPAIGLNLDTSLLSWMGDCFFDKNAGVDWLTRLGSKNQSQLLQADLRRIILTSFGVTGISNFATVLNIRAFTANYGVNTIFTKSYQQSVTQGVTQNA